MSPQYRAQQLGGPGASYPGQIGRTLRGRLHGAGGAPPDGLYDLAVVAYDSHAGKEVVAYEEIPSVAVFSGTFTVELWSTLKEPPDVGDGSAYVEMVVGDAGSERVRIPTVEEQPPPGKVAEPVPVTFELPGLPSPKERLPKSRSATGGELEVLAVVGTAGHPLPGALAVRDGLAYVGEHDVNAESSLVGSWVEIFDVSDPVAPGWVARVPPPPPLPGTDLRFPGPMALAVEPPYLYVLWDYNTPPQNVTLQVIDVAVPHQPRVVGALSMFRYWDDLAVQGTHLYFNGGVSARPGRPARSGLIAIDVADPAHPHAVGAARPFVSAFQVAVHKDIAWALTSEPPPPLQEAGPRVNQYGLEKPATPKLYTSELVPLCANRLACDGRAAYVTSTSGRPQLTVVDAVPPEEPEPGPVGRRPHRQSSVPLLTEAWQLETDGGGYVATLNNGANLLQLFDVRDLTAPSEAAFLEITPEDNSFGGLAMAGRYIYVSQDRSKTLRIIDMSPVTG